MPTIEISQEQADALAAGQDVRIALAAPKLPHRAVYVSVRDQRVFEVVGPTVRMLRGRQGSQRHLPFRALTADDRRVFKDATHYIEVVSK